MPLQLWESRSEVHTLVDGAVEDGVEWYDGGHGDGEDQVIVT